MPAARGSEKMVPSIEGEFARKRRMMSHVWIDRAARRHALAARLRPALRLMILSHRVLRYSASALHLIALVTNAFLLGRGLLYDATFAVQVALCVAAALRPRASLPGRPLLRRDERLDRPRPVGLPAQADAHPLGGGGGHAVIRRTIDVLVAGGVLLLASPLLALAALAIRLTSRGPVIYRQRRVGLGGAEFDLLKLRTMVEGAEQLGAGLWVDEDDSRITRVGALLRRTSLDELPNLWNVLRGEMSLIGPRPTVPEQVAVYTERQRGRLAIRPGITGWAQVNGRAALPWGQRIELDLQYIEHRSLALDLRILARTLPLLLHGGGLYRGETGGWDLPPLPGYDPPRSGSGTTENDAPRT